MGDSRKLLYENALLSEHDIHDFRLEGEANISFPGTYMHMENAVDDEMGQKANYVLWCPETFPADVEIQWEFKPLTDYGLCILFFCAAGKGRKDLFDDTLSTRNGEYDQYHSGDMDAFHVSYFRRKEVDERAFHVCNLRKSCGFHLVAQGADPIPEAMECKEFYKITVKKLKNRITFQVNGLTLFVYEDDGATYGDVLGGGKIGFRQLAPLKAAYRNLKVYQL